MTDNRKRGNVSLSPDHPDAEVAYVTLPDHPGDGTPGCVKRMERLFDLIGDYNGPDVYFDFDENNTLIGIELLL